VACGAANCAEDGGARAGRGATSERETARNVNRSGDRQVNQALHLVVLTRLRYDPATRAYAEWRRPQGKTNREIRRCLGRYVARQLYRLLEATPALDTT
jgi:transposase